MQKGRVCLIPLRHDRAAMLLSKALTSGCRMCKKQYQRAPSTRCMWVESQRLQPRGTPPGTKRHTMITILSTLCCRIKIAAVLTVRTSSIWDCLNNATKVPVQPKSEDKLARWRRVCAKKPFWGRSRGWWGPIRASGTTLMCLRIWQPIIMCRRMLQWFPLWLPMILRAPLQCPKNLTENISSTSMISTTVASIACFQRAMEVKTHTTSRWKTLSKTALVTNTRAATLTMVISSFGCSTRSREPKRRHCVRSSISTRS